MVALDVKTGQVLAMASFPDYDPNDFAEGISADSPSADALPADIIPHSGDYVFRGELIGNVTPAEFLCDENCVLVRSVHDNRRTVDNIPQCFPHWRLTA